MTAPGISLDDWQANGLRFDFRGHSIFYMTEGSGPVVLCIHGFPTASWDWHAIWPGLAERFRVIAPDMLGFGFSDKPPAHSYTLMEQANLHVALAARRGLRDVHVLAHDYGVSVAQELLARHHEGSLPFAIRSVCFLNGGLFPESHRPLLTQKILASPLGPMASRFVGERTLGRGLARVFGKASQPSKEALRDFWRLVSYQDGHRISHRLIAYIAERRRHRERWVGALLAAPVPMRLIVGPEDPVSGRHLAARYAEQVPGADVVTLDGIGHYPQVEAPAAVLAAYLDFYASHAGYAIR